MTSHNYEVRLSARETSSEKPSRRGAWIKSVAGTAVVAIVGYFGAATMQIIGAPKDSVAYDLIQSWTGMLKPAASQPEPKVAAESRSTTDAKPSAPLQPAGSLQPSASPAAPKDPPPQTRTVTVAPTGDGPLSGLGARPSGTSALLPSAAPAPSAGEAAQADAPPSNASTEPAPPGYKDQRTIALRENGEETVCRLRFRVEFYSVAADRIALRWSDGSSGPVKLTVGKVYNLTPTCTVTLVRVMDGAARIAEVYETITR